MDIHWYDYVVWAVTCGATLFLWWDSYPSVNLYGSPIGIICVAYTMFILFGEDIPQIRDIVYEVRVQVRERIDAYREQRQK